MQQMPPADLGGRPDHLRVQQSAAADLVRAIYHMTQTKQGISSIELGRRLGVTQTTAWKMKHKLKLKLKQVMLERDAAKHVSMR